MHNLEQSSAAKVWDFFEQICSIPHGSGNEAALLRHICEWATAKKLKTAQDNAGNLVVYAPGTAGYENSPTLILQSHVDMVCEKNNDVKHDFEKDGIRTLREGDVLRADGTTLGADNGIGVAMMMAILDGDHPHPPIEAVFTVNEEIGLVGAALFDMTLVSGKRFLNLDTEEYGVFVASNAGGRHGLLRFPAQWQAAKAEAWLQITISGLQGGHSGMDIDKERGNAIFLMGRVLESLRKTAPAFLLANMHAGSKENAIPRESTALVGLAAGDVPKLNTLLAELGAAFAKELAQSDAGVTLQGKVAPAPARALSLSLRDKLLAGILLMPNGVQSMSRDIPGLVESSNNLGVVFTNDEEIQLLYSTRSCIKSLKEATAHRIDTLAHTLGGSVEVLADYPPWEYCPHSAMRELFTDCYTQLTGKEPVVTAMHCGLECGTFSDAIDGLDVLSLGPDLTDVHSPQERVSISSTERAWALLLAGLSKMK